MDKELTAIRFDIFTNGRIISLPRKHLPVEDYKYQLELSGQVRTKFEEKFHPFYILTFSCQMSSLLNFLERAQFKLSLITNDSKADRAKSRRVEIHIP